jgi:hypothetical protein
LAGPEITAGQQIGVVGRSGVSLGPHLFFGMLFANHLSVDPRPFLNMPLCGDPMKAIEHRRHSSELWMVGEDLASSRRYNIDLSSR